MKSIVFKRSGLLIATAVGLGCLSAWSIQTHLTNRAQELESRSRTATLSRVVAARAMPKGTTLALSDLAKQEFPVYSLGTGSIGPSDVQWVQGKQLTVDLTPGQLIRDVHRADKMPMPLASKLGQDKRAVTIPVDSMSSLSGLLKPGDLVDLYVTFSHRGQSNTALLIEGIEVLATGQQTESEASSKSPENRQYSTMTLAANPTEASKLVVARQGGTVTAVLRNEQSSVVSNNQPLLTGNLPSLLGLETQEARSGVEVIYGDRLFTDMNVISSAEMFTPAQPSLESGLP